VSLSRLDLLTCFFFILWLISRRFQFLDYEYTVSKGNDLEGSWSDLVWIYLLSTFILALTWSIAHPWNALFHFSFLILKHSVGLLRRGISPSQGRYLHRTTQTQNERRLLSMSWVGFEPTIPVFERAKIFHALERGHRDRLLIWILSRELPGRSEENHQKSQYSQHPEQDSNLVLLNANSELCSYSNAICIPNFLSIIEMKERGNWRENEKTQIKDFSKKCWYNF
jgi:hypothetical protein